MKTTLLHLLFLSSLCAGKYGPDFEAPACAADCARQLANQTQAGSLPAICANAVKQRSFFQCLVDSCQSHSYGQALAYAISACSNLGADISPLHPIEVRYLAPTPRRRQVPARSPSLLPKAPTLSERLSMDRRFAVMLDCQAGPDGLVTLSVANPTKAAARLDGSQPLGNEASIENLSSGSLRQNADGSFGGKEAASSGPDCESEPALSPTALSGISTQAAAPASDGDYPCKATPSSPVPDSTCSSMLQSPAGDEQTPSLPTSTVVLASTGSVVDASSAPTSDCPETVQAANVTTVGTGSRPSAADSLTSWPSGTALLTSGPPSTSSCLESAAAPLTMQPTTDSRPAPSGGGNTGPSAVNGSVASAGEDCPDSSTAASVTAVTAPNSSAPSPLNVATSCEGQMSGQAASCDSCSSQGTQTEPRPSSTAEGVASQVVASKTPLPVDPSVLRTSCISNSSISTSPLATQGATNGSVNATAAAAAAGASGPPTSSLSAPTWTSPIHTPAAPKSVPAAYTSRASPPAYQPPLAAYSFVKTPAMYGASVSAALNVTGLGNSSAPGSRPTSAVVSSSGGTMNSPQAASAQSASTDAASYGLGSGGNDGAGTAPASPSVTPSESPSKATKDEEYGTGNGSTQRATTTALPSTANGGGTPQQDSSTRCTTLSTQTAEGGAAVKGVKEVILVTLISSAANGEMQTRVKTIQQPQPAAAAAAMTGAAQGRSGANDDQDRKQPGFLLAVDGKVDKAARRRSTTWPGLAPAVATGRSCRMGIPTPAVLWTTVAMSILAGELLVAALVL